MEEPVTLRPVFGRVLTILIWAIVGAVIIALVVAGDWVHLVTAIAPLLLVAFATWMGFWAPCVKLSPAGVELVNVFRTRTVTWPAIQRIETKYSLTLYTKVGRFSAWAAPAPSRFAAMTASRRDLGGLPESTYSAENRVGLGDLPTSDSGLAALHVRRAWEGYRDAGQLGAVEGTGVKTSWHPVILVVLAVLVVGALLSVTL